MTDFDISLRGYDRHTVDTLVRAVHAAAGDPDRIESLIAGAEPLTMALRGYDRAQVDAWLASCRTLLPAPTPDSSFRPTIVLRGYRIAETDALFAKAEAAIGENDPFRRAAALRAIAEARLPVSFRGYDRGQVDAHLSRVTEALA
ncbi:DivIVA domain-containing protein [Asanoa ishikariensis]|uniref:DivIVA domain-containing protein n=1 Tax=Asanoa ishikariensis TaxID=137265 RepID=UPI0015A23B5B|nr:DivIVA domain-containing protein [Asanoa ishikariensis]